MYIDEFVHPYLIYHCFVCVALAVNRDTPCSWFIIVIIIIIMLSLWHTQWTSCKPLFVC